MNLFRIPFQMILLLLIGCNVINSPTSTQGRSAATVSPVSTLWPTPTNLPTSTPIIPTIASTMMETSCQPTTNPFPTQLPNGNYLFHENLSIGKVCYFEGQMARGETYIQDTTQGLDFCLPPFSLWIENGGWEINISDHIGDPCDDYFAGIATPPFSGGDNPTFIQGWQFRNGNNTAPNNDNYFGMSRFTREFNFVFNQRDYEALFESYFNLPSNNDVNLSQIKSSRGILTIKSLELGNLIPNRIPWVESMKFEVKIYLPSD